MLKKILSFNHVNEPFVQAILCFLSGLGFMLLGNIAKALGLQFGKHFEWTTAGAFLLLFAIFNSINLLPTKDLNKYWQQSIISFIGLIVGLSFAAFLLSAKSIGEAGSFRFIFVVLVFGYLTFMAIVAFIRRMFLIVQAEDKKMNP